MIAPVTDVGPGILGLGLFPVDALTSDPIGVVAIRRTGVHELRDHVLGKAGNRGTQCLPVLENIPPVPLVVENFVAVVVFHFDREPIPRSRWVTVTPTEGQWQVFHAQTLELQIAHSRQMVKQFMLTQLVR